MWKELAKIALLGTERTSLSSDISAHLENLGIAKDQVKTQILLAGAGFYAQMNKAGYVLKDYQGNLPILKNTADEKFCSPKSTKHLQLILDNTFEEALPEFIFQLNKNQKELSPKNLPDLLNKCLESDAFFQKLKPVIGKRGWWLINQNPAWSKLNYFPKPEYWSSNDLNKRVKFLGFYREKEPKKGLEILMENWDKESTQSKTALLKSLKIGLSPSDEFFLEHILYDTRKEVREVAVRLLTVLPDSQLIERMFIRLKDLIRFDGKKLKFFLPDELDETMLRDGIQVKIKSYEGERADILHQMISRIPPPIWGTFFDLPAKEILSLFIQNEWASPLIRGIFNAILTHKQARTWATAFLEIYLEKGNTPLWQNLSIKELPALISDEDFNKITSKYLTQNRQLLSEKSPIMTLLLNSNHLWNDSLTMMVIGRFRNWLSNATSYHWDKWHYKALLKNVAYRCNPNLFEKLKNGWNNDAPAWGMWEENITQFLKILIFRKEMTGELENG